MAKSWAEVKALLDDPTVPPDTKKMLISSWQLENGGQNGEEAGKYADAYGSDLFSARPIDDAFDEAKKAGDQAGYNEHQEKKAVDDGRTQLEDKQPPVSGGGTKTSDELFDAAAPALKLFETFGSLLAKIPDDCRGNTRPIDLDKDIRSRFDEQRGINFANFLADADHFKNGATTLEQTISDSGTALSTLFRTWTGSGADAASDNYNEKILPKAKKLVQTLEDVSQATSTTTDTVFQLCKGKADAVIHLYTDQVGKADYMMAQKVVAIANGEQGSKNDLAQIAGWMDLNFGTDLVQHINDPGCCKGDELRKHGQDLAKQWVQNQFNPDMWDRLYKGFEKICTDAVDLINKAYDALDDVMGKVKNEFTDADQPGVPGGAGPGGSGPGGSGPGGAGAGAFGPGGSGPGGFGPGGPGAAGPGSGGADGFGGSGAPGPNGPGTSGPSGTPGGAGGGAPDLSGIGGSSGGGTGGPSGGGTPDLSGIGGSSGDRTSPSGGGTPDLSGIGGSSGGGTGGPSGGGMPDLSGIGGSSGGGTGGPSGGGTPDLSGIGGSPDDPGSAGGDTGSGGGSKLSSVLAGDTPSGDTSPAASGGGSAGGGASGPSGPDQSAIEEAKKRAASALDSLGDGAPIQTESGSGPGGSGPGGTDPLMGKDPFTTGDGKAGGDDLAAGDPGSKGFDPSSGDAKEWSKLADGEADSLKGGSGDGPETLKVEQGGKTFEMTEPDSHGAMDIKVGDGTGEPKDFRLDWSGHQDGGGADDPGQPNADGAYQPGPDGKIHIQDGDLKVTAERPDGPDGPTKVTFDDGSGKPTTYTLGESDHSSSSPDNASPAKEPPPATPDSAGDERPSGFRGDDLFGDKGNPISTSSAGGGVGGAGISAGVAGVGSPGGTPLEPGVQTGVGAHQPAVPAGAAAPGAGAPVGPGAPQASTSSSGMGGMMGGMGAGGGGGENQERNARAYRIDGNIFDTGEKPGPRIIGSLDDDGDRPAKKGR